MPAIRLLTAMAAVAWVGLAAPSWSADAPVPPASSEAAPPSETPPKDQSAPAPSKDAPPPDAVTKTDPVVKSEPPSAASTVAKPPSVTVIDSVDAHGILGRDVRSPANENMGRIADVIVDRAGQVRAAVIDFGGFLGVGSRKIVVEWNALHFWNVADKTASITLDLTREQVRAAPEYKDDAPIVVLGASGALSPLRFQPLTMQER